MLDLPRVYVETKHNLLAVVGDAPVERLHATVPATPDWTVLDVVAHLTGIAGLAANGDIPADLDLVRALSDADHAARRDELADATVTSRRGRSLDELIEEWDATERELLPMLRGDRPFPVPVAFADAILTTDLAVQRRTFAAPSGYPGTGSRPASAWPWSATRRH